MADYSWGSDRSVYKCCFGSIPHHKGDCIYIRGFDKDYHNDLYCRGCGCFIARAGIHEKVCQNLQDLVREETDKRERNTI